MARKCHREGSATGNQIRCFWCSEQKCGQFSTLIIYSLLLFPFPPTVSLAVISGSGTPKTQFHGWCQRIKNARMSRQQYSLGCLRWARRIRGASSYDPIVRSIGIFVWLLFQLRKKNLPSFFFLLRSNFVLLSYPLSHEFNLLTSSLSRLSIVIANGKNLMASDTSDLLHIRRTFCTRSLEICGDWGG